MRRIVAVLAVLFLVLAGGCAGSGKFVMDLKPETPKLGIDPSKKLPLRLAVVVPDPMGYNFTYIGAKGYKRDMTADFRAGSLFLEREVSRVASETLQQAFQQVVVVRDLPQPGEYDGVARAEIGKVSMLERVMVTGESCDVTTEWTLGLLDRENREILSKKGVDAGGNFKWSAFNPTPGFRDGMSVIMSATVARLAKEWADILYGSDALRTQPARKEAKP